MDIHEMAVSGAKKICASGICIGDFSCGHANNKPLQGVPRVSDLAACPLAKYELEPAADALDPQNWLNHTYEELNPSSDEIWAICAECDNATIDGSTVSRKDLRICCDCPAKSAEDAQVEAEAEC